jgi:predicted MPP superfamily phosphohydrolase
MNYTPILKKLLFVVFIIAVGQSGFAQNNIINMAFSSDAHYGITRANFRGDTGVAGYKVNAAMIKQMNSLPALTLPRDSGVGAGKPIAAVDYVVQTGDIANRQEVPIQSATISWSQFETDYIKNISLKGHNGKPAGLFVVPGNHDISNAIGYHKEMKPLTDPTSMVKIYNLMLKPKTPLTNAQYNYKTYKVNYSRNIQGIHLMFITLWPDSAERVWMQHDLDTVAKTTPVMIFTHDQPTCEAKHFVNPKSGHTINTEDKFENLTTEYYKDAIKGKGDKGSTDIEQRGWVAFLKQHPNIKAYFHGNSNWNEFYTYTGPDNDVSLNTFRVDSPMKGKYSSKDETLLSFQLISLDTKSQTLTVRECLWNTKPQDKNQQVVFGKSATVSLKVN